MITFGTVNKTLGASWKNVPHEVIEGYYIVLPNGDRHWFAKSCIYGDSKLNAICDKYLTKETNWEYWIDYCFGYDVSGNLAWSNIDQTDKFI